MLWAMLVVSAVAAPVTETQDRVAGRVGAFTKGSGPTVDGGGHTGMAGDTAADFRNYWTGAVYVPDGTFLNASTVHDELSVSFWQKRYNAFGDSSYVSFWFNSIASNGDHRGFQAHLPWVNGDVAFDTAGCCDPGIHRISAFIDTFPDYSGAPSWWESWHFFVFSKKGPTKQIWIDGKLFLEGPSTAPLPIDFADHGDWWPGGHRRDALGVPDAGRDR
jgi:hypothetical protein